MSLSCRMVSMVLYYYYIPIIIYILYYLVFKILSSFVRDSSYHDMYYAHTKSLLTQQFQSEAWDLICMYIIVHALYIFKYGLISFV